MTKRWAPPAKRHTYALAWAGRGRFAEFSSENMRPWFLAEDLGRASRVFLQCDKGRRPKPILSRRKDPFAVHAKGDRGKTGPAPKGFPGWPVKMMGSDRQTASAREPTLTITRAPLLRVGASTPMQERLGVGTDGEQLA